VAPGKPRNCQNLLPGKFKMADGLRIFNLVCICVRSNFENMQKLGQRGCDPVYATYNLNSRTPVNISQMAKAVESDSARRKTVRSRR